MNIGPLCTALLYVGVLSFSSLGWTAEQGEAGKLAKPLFGYIPPLRGAPTARIGTGTRGGENTPVTGTRDNENPFATKSELHLDILAPNHTGFTLTNTPTVYWYISSASPGPILLQVGSQRQAFPIVEQTIPKVAKAGIYRLSFDDINLQLEQDLDYEIRLTPLNSNKQSVGSSYGKGRIRYIETTAALQSELNSTSAQDLAAFYGKQGIWYDMFHSLSDEGVAGDSQSHSTQRGQVLRQVGLESAAGFLTEK